MSDWILSNYKNLLSNSMNRPVRMTATQAVTFTPVNSNHNLYLLQSSFYLYQRAINLIHNAH
jgi:hypothetical protein